MDLEKATELAIAIACNRPSWQVIAIGRFLPVDQIRPESPFGISLRIPGEEKPRVIWSADEADLPLSSSPQLEPAAAGYLF